MNNPNLFLEYEEADFEFMGMKMMKWDSSTKTDKRCFIRIFGCNSKICETLCKMLLPNLKSLSGVTGKHLLWALMFLKLYAEEPTHASMAGGVDEKNISDLGVDYNTPNIRS